MPKPKSEKPQNATPKAEASVHDDYELPDDLDFEKLDYVGIGTDALKRHVEAKRGRTVVLAPDVAEAIRTADEVNEALRTVIHAAQHLRERAKPDRKASA